MPWRRRYVRLEARRLNRRLPHESCTVNIRKPNVCRGCSQQIDSHSVKDISVVHSNITKT
ncbi:hypothetical protein DPMN_054422 [Dreissena polymorpha]|uniref:Uncharacterized protein n=1 Tax=Dreissena polymorpha TaxID=45954 RepID=A0A9D4CQJ5_DREPO|nr:hypothetical protein DPMN_054422 [Dreissena polymorpha]